MNQSRKRASRTSKLNYVSLESRQLLAGDVSVFVNDGVLLIVGDELANQIQITSSGNQISIAGEGTTVNGSADPFLASNRYKFVTISMRGGNDSVQISDISFRQNLSIRGGDGNDRLQLNRVSAYHYHVNVDAGDDAIELLNSSSGQSAYFFLGSGDDVISAPSFRAGRNFKVFGGNGSDTFVSGQLGVKRKLVLELGNGNDQAFFAGSTNVRNRSTINLGRGNDILGILPEQMEATSYFRKRLSIIAGAGNDTVLLDDSVTARRPARVDGGAGTDSIETGDADLHRRTRIRNFESVAGVGTSNELLDQVFSRLNEVGFDSSFLGNREVRQLSLVLSRATLAFTENDAVTAIDPLLEIGGASDQQVTSATVTILSGGSNEDSLLFDDANGISGTYSESTRILQLTGTGSISDYQSALRSVRYSNSSEDPTDNDRTIEFSIVGTSVGTPVADQLTLQVIPVDDPLELSLPGVFGAISDPIGFEFGNQISFTADGTDLDHEIVYQLDLDASGITASANQPVIDAQTGLFIWMPSENGTFPIRVLATNSAGDSDQESFTVVVGQMTTTTASGLEFLDFEIGTGDTPVRADSVVVDYVGYFESGEVFDSGESVEFALTNVIEGFAEGIEGMQVGGRRRIIVPPSLGFLDNRFGDLPILFDINLRQIV